MDLKREHMEIVGSDGQHVGSLDRVCDGVLLLASGDPRSARGPGLPLEMVDSIDSVIRLNAPARDVIKRWFANTNAAENPPPS